MSSLLLSADAVHRALTLRDLSDPAHGPHAMQLLLQAMVASLQGAWGCPAQEHRLHPIVSIADNYDQLRYPADGAARQARYTRYVTPTTLLRTQTSAMIPPLLRTLASAPLPDALLVCPGLTYRRDAIDRLHSAEPHQLDLWRITTRERMELPDLRAMVERVVAAVLPGSQWRLTPTTHPYTMEGQQIDILSDGAWIEIGECGLVLPQLLDACGLMSARTSGLAMGLGLDRLLMLRKGVPDIRLLRARDPRIASQMLDLAPYRAVSMMPPLRRDLSLVRSQEADGELLGDLVREALGVRACWVESVTVVAQTRSEDLPPAAAQRLGILHGSWNLLLRVVLRDLERTLSVAEGNQARDDIYAALHQGTIWQWITPRGTPP